MTQLGLGLAPGPSKASSRSNRPDISSGTRETRPGFNRTTEIWRGRLPQPNLSHRWTQIDTDEINGIYFFCICVHPCASVAKIRTPRMTVPVSVIFHLSLAFQPSRHALRKKLRACHPIWVVGVACRPLHPTPPAPLAKGGRLQTAPPLLLEARQKPNPNSKIRNRCLTRAAHEWVARCAGSRPLCSAP
jgi:hypothetical protein